MLICLIILLILIWILGYKVYKLDKQIIMLKEDMKEYQKTESTKREIGWDSIWKMVNQR
tara:strand:- start:589 stop:765 length:177 start_codon:yes stop_codon:yes gene_type:complete